MDMRRKARDAAGLLSEDTQQAIVEFTNLALYILRRQDSAFSTNHDNIDKVQREFDRGLITSKEYNNEILGIFTDAQVNLYKSIEAAQRLNL